jgi:hypothetical protein
VDASFGDPAAGTDGEGPFGVATSPDGAVYISDSDIDRIRRVLPDGSIDTVARARHPKATSVQRTASGHDLIVPEWDINRVSRLRGIDVFDLNVERAGSGTGRVTGTGIDCGTDCTAPPAAPRSRSPHARRGLVLRRLVRRGLHGHGHLHGDRRRHAHRHRDVHA